MSHHYRAHKMSVWLNLIPQLQKTGLGLHSQSASASVDSLNLASVEDGGATWGVLRNGSNVQAAIDKGAEVKPFLKKISGGFGEKGFKIFLFPPPRSRPLPARRA